MKVLLALIFFCLSWCNYTFSKEINIPSVVATLDNLENPEIAKLLAPPQ